MVTTPASPRPRWVVVFVSAAVTVVLFAIISILVASFNDDTPQSPTAAAPAPQEPDFPTFTSPSATEQAEEPEPSPSTTPTTEEPPAIPPNGDKRGCPTKDGVDKDDEYCSQRDLKKKFKKYFAKNKVNGAWRFEVNEKGSFRRVSLSPTNTVTSFETKISDEAPTPEPDASGVEWVIRQSTFDTDDVGEFYRLRYFSNSRLKVYGVYYQVGTGIGNWKLAYPANDKKFYTGTYYQVVVFWHDPDAPESATPAPVPPAFSWGDVEKPVSS